jgi:hypothetical protein
MIDKHRKTRWVEGNVRDQELSSRPRRAERTRGRVPGLEKLHQRRTGRRQHQEPMMDAMLEIKFLDLVE